MAQSVSDSHVSPLLPPVTSRLSHSVSAGCTDSLVPPHPHKFPVMAPARLFTFPPNPSSSPSRRQLVSFTHSEHRPPALLLILFHRWRSLVRWIHFTPPPFLLPSGWVSLFSLISALSFFGFPPIVWTFFCFPSIWDVKLPVLLNPNHYLASSVSQGGVETITCCL